MPFRMTDYRVRIYRGFPNKDLQQVVVHLRPSRSPLIYQNRFEITSLQHEYQVIRLWEQPTELFLQAPGLLPFAVLTQTENREEVREGVGQKKSGAD
ncbi:MAG: hypothetical protein ACFB4I_17360 [Cyanophyceae cyanobacterium]